MTLKQKLIKFAVEHIDQLAQTTGKTVIGEPFENQAMFAACRTAAAEGMVLLKNEGLLPLPAQDRIACFGRVQNDWFYVGYGSGGDVNPPYRVSPMAALRRRGAEVHEELAARYASWCAQNPPFDGVWGMWPTCYDEMPLSRDQICAAAETCRTAVVFLGRAMGESMDNRRKKGCYYLNDQERNLLDQVTDVFEQTVVVINAGNIIDLGWIREYESRIGAVLYAFHGGMESGNALVDVLYGDVNPSGKLTDTIALTYRDYPTSGRFGDPFRTHYQEDIYVGYRYFETFAPERVLYPFGFGLSYTTFALESTFKNGELTVKVTNTGHRSGREVVQVYVNPPQGKMGKPLRSLVAFQKTGLLQPGQEEMIRFALDPAAFASYDDSGITGHPYCYVLEPGAYGLYVGTDVRSAVPVGNWNIDVLTVTQVLSSQAGPAKAFLRMRPVQDPNGKWIPGFETVSKTRDHRKYDVLKHLPTGNLMTGDVGIRFEDVCQGKATPEAFVAQLNIRELDAITRGEGAMNSSLGALGNAGVFGGTIPSLREKGVPVITTTDGPSGIRVSAYASLLPCGTALACSWDPALVERLGQHFGAEMGEKGSDVLLGPGMNIHRDPLCGRNFEYYSEDPYLSGRIGAAMVRGIQSNPGRSACPKHFACNNQEWMRNIHDACLSERALREIYLKGFEICVKESSPLTMMTSYNKINGIWTHYHYDLVTNILRKEWGYQGLVITDWWMQPWVDPVFPALSNDACRLRAQVDVLMPGGVANGKAQGDGSLEKSYRTADGITLGEIQRCAVNVVKFCMRLKSDIQ